MKNIINEITKLRSGVPIVIDHHNSNRYRIVVCEKDGTRTAYYFSTPIYNCTTRKLVDMKFVKKGDLICATGSNANISVDRYLSLSNTEGTVSVKLPQMPIQISSQELQSGPCTIIPTANGVLVKYDVSSESTHAFTLEVGEPYLNVRVNDRCFALMKEEFRPLAVLSCLGSADVHDNIIAPAWLEYKKLTEQKYEVIMSAKGTAAKSIIYEINMYENKLFQDTTVESASPYVNNAFGGTGFIGNSAAFGEQWLYTRLDYSRLPELMDKRINKAVIHIPKLNRSNTETSVFEVSSRFCSFGSNWDNKIPAGRFIGTSISTNDYQNIDITSLIAETYFGTVFDLNGLILKSENKENVFSVLATGDSYFAPQILEVNYW